MPKSRYQWGAPGERALLVGITLPTVKREDEIENLRELEALARTAGAAVVGHAIQNRTRIDGSTYIGKGKVEELIGLIHEHDVNLIVFDDDLSPAQARNLEKALEINVIDRTELILDIFARRARTRQARIQVEIAQLNYALPRLRRLWEHLSRQEGGIGTRGPGETQIEVDRRKAHDRISHLNRELQKIGAGVGERRKRRRDLFNVTIVGYTNAGKSTLLNRLAGSSVLESSELFSTLDSTTRRVRASSGETFLLTDTIGFIRKLPTHLVASFKATLQDVREADLLLHIVDAAHPRYEDHVAVVNAVLEEVLRGAGTDGAAPGREGGAPSTGTDTTARGHGDTGRSGHVPTILVLNKCDLLDAALRRAAANRHPGAALVSAATGEGADGLLELIESRLGGDLVDAEIEVAADDGRAVAAVEGSSKVLARKLVGGRLLFSVRIHRDAVAALERLCTVRLRPASLS
jgi:GTP-binding protein HflX